MSASPPAPSTGASPEPPSAGGSRPDRRDHRPARAPAFRALVYVCTALLSVLIRLWFATLRVTVLGAENDLGSRPGRFGVYATWHRGVLLSIHLWRGRRGYMIASASKDGEWAAGLIERFGNRAVRGSSSKGGRAALQEIVEKMAQGASGGMLTDAPRGPARASKPGVLVLAQRTGYPIIATQFGMERGYRLRTWDGTLFPRPFSRVVVAFGAPFPVDPSLEGEAFDARLKEFDAHMNRLTDEVDGYFGLTPSPAAP